MEEWVGITTEIEGWAQQFGINLSGEVLLALSIFTIIVLGGGIFWLLRRWQTSPAERFRSVLAGEDAVTVLLHPNPDPDAMASGLAVAAIAEAVDTPVQICYPGSIRHHENRAFRTVLDLDLTAIERANDIADGSIVLVDHGRPRGFTNAKEINPIAIIDHHDETPVTASHVDVRPDYGACATIFVEYLRDLDTSSNESNTGDNSLSPATATALLYGIYTDTNTLTRGCTSREFAAVEYLYPRIDPSLLDRIANPSVEAGILEAKSRAVERRELRDCYVVADIGLVDATEAIPMAAEELLRLEGVTAAAVIGDNNGTIHISGRSVDDRVHMGDAIQRALEPVHGASAGGHARMGGGQVPEEYLDSIGPSSSIQREQLTEELFAAMRGSA